jgi:hypothetical protein
VSNALAAKREVAITFRVYVPIVTENVFVAGTFNNWDPRGLRLESTPNGIIFTASVTILEGDIIEYKYTLGSWQTVEMNANRLDRPNRRAEARYGDSGKIFLQDRVEAWKSTAEETLLDEIRQKSGTYSAKALADRINDNLGRPISKSLIVCQYCFSYLGYTDGVERYSFLIPDEYRRRAERMHIKIIGEKMFRCPNCGKENLL